MSGCSKSIAKVGSDKPSVQLPNINLLFIACADEHLVAEKSNLVDDTLVSDEPVSFGSCPQTEKLQCLLRTAAVDPLPSIRTECYGIDEKITA